MSKMICEINQSALGIETYIRLYEDHVEIKKTGPGGDTRNYLHRSFPLFDIESVYVKPAKGFLATGIIQFNIENEKKPIATMLNLQFLDNALNISSKHNVLALQMKEYIEAYNR